MRTRAELEEMFEKLTRAIPTAKTVAEIDQLNFMRSGIGWALGYDYYTPKIIRDEHSYPFNPDGRLNFSL